MRKISNSAWIHRALWSDLTSSVPTYIHEFAPILVLRAVLSPSLSLFRAHTIFLFYRSFLFWGLLAPVNFARTSHLNARRPSKQNYIHTGFPHREIARINWNKSWEDINAVRIGPHTYVHERSTSIAVVLCWESRQNVSTATQYLIFLSSFFYMFLSFLYLFSLIWNERVWSMLNSW